MSPTKICTKCRETKDTSFFYNQKDGTHGVRGDCKDCVNAHTRARVAALSPEKKQRKKDQERAWVQNNRKHFNETARAWKTRNAHRVKEYRAGYDLRYPHKRGEIARRRKERERTAPGGPFSPHRPDYQPRVLELNGMCGYCLKRRYQHMDHAQPISRDGTNFPENIWPVCAPCNVGRGGKHDKILYEEWIPPKDRHLARERIAALIIALGS